MSLNKLIKTARKSTHRSFHHATLVIRGGAILSAGYNHGDRHSEVVALSKLWPNKRSGCIIVNIRITKKAFSNSRPCPDCANYIRNAGIKKVIYSDSDGSFKEMKI